MVFDPNAQNIRFGEIAQQANPQVSDPNQNRNLGGFPGGKRFNYVNNELQKPALGVPAVPPGTAPTTQPVIGTPGMAPAARFSSMPLPTRKVIDPAAERAALDAIPEKHRNSSLDGRYGNGGYEPISDEQQWTGRGYSGADPREATIADAAPATPTAPPPGAAGGKGGQMVNANEAMTGAGFTPPGGASGGKSGGESPVPVGTAPAAPAVPAAPAAPAAPASPIVPAGEIGQTGGTNPDGSPIVYDDTGAYNPGLGETGGFGGEPFKPNNSIPGVQTKKPNLDNPHPKVAKRLAEYKAAGGDPANLVVIDNSIWPSILEKYPASERGKIKQQMKDKFYADQIAALGVGRPGVQED